MAKDISTVIAGELLGTTEWLQIDQGKINAFADATGDHQWIHVDQARCEKESPYGTTIAHGFLSASLISEMMQKLIWVDDSRISVINYGIDSLRFLEPVRCGDLVRYRFDVVKRIEKKLGTRIKLNCVVEIQARTKPAMQGEFLILLMNK